MLQRSPLALSEPKLERSGFYAWSSSAFGLQTYTRLCAFGCIHAVLRVPWVWRVASGAPWTDIGCSWVDQRRLMLSLSGSLPSNNWYRLPETSSPNAQHPPTATHSLLTLIFWLVAVMVLLALAEFMVVLVDLAAFGGGTL